jgi:nitrate reductase NapE component
MNEVLMAVAIIGGFGATIYFFTKVMTGLYPEKEND